MQHFFDVHAFNREDRSQLTDIPALIYDRKTAVRRFDTIREILRFISQFGVARTEGLTDRDQNTYLEYIR